MNDAIPRRRANDDDAADSLRLLLVDDDPSYRAWLATVTRRMGFHVVAAEDGQDALDRLAAESFDIAVVDQSMPRVTGIEVIARLRAQDSTSLLYTIMLTGHDAMEAKLTALSAGFDDFLSKTSPEAEIAARLLVARRIAARQRTLDSANRELYGLATRDQLTGVFNRRFFITESERLLATKCILNVVIFDLDEFKAVNDQFGHLAGDQVLSDVGQVFQKKTRAVDLIARYGGDEFVLLVPHASFGDLQRLAVRISEQIRALSWRFGSQSFSISSSTGIASSRQLMQPSLPRLLDLADRDLYRNKWLHKDPAERPEQFAQPFLDTTLDIRTDRDTESTPPPAPVTPPIPEPALARKPPVV